VSQKTIGKKYTISPKMMSLDVETAGLEEIRWV
jgi:hypothetical protein